MIRYQVRMNLSYFILLIIARSISNGRESYSVVSNLEIESDRIKSFKSDGMQKRFSTCLPLDSDT